jgi:tRNA(His) guanylyltransferase
MTLSKDDLGDRVKSYEERETSRRFLPMLPVCARIDGRSFSAFTRDMERPYDENMSQVMRRTTATLVEETHARIGYTQSDEISLCWLSEASNQGIFFNHKITKMTSVLAGLATAAFSDALLRGPLAPMIYPSADTPRLPHFDCRVFQVPSKTEAANVFLWRERDATKNAVSMAARYYYSHKELNGKTCPEMQEMLFAKGVNFNDYPPFFKRGTFVRRVPVERQLTPTEYLRIPAKHRPHPTTPVIRTETRYLSMPSFGKVLNRVGVIFDSEEPITIFPESPA